LTDVGLPVLIRTIRTAFAAPAGTPPEVMQILNREINKVLAEPEIAGAFAENGTYVVGGSPERFREPGTPTRRSGWTPSPRRECNLNRFVNFMPATRVARACVYFHIA
jgi:hypothetical protein